MSLKKWFSGAVLTVVSAVALTACGGNNTGGGGGALQVGTAGEQLAYQPTTLTAPAGSVTVNFKNNSSGLQHNWVLVRSTDEAVLSKIDEAAVSAGAPNYLPTDPNIVKATAMLAGGANERITFDVQPGTYTFICTYPGHYGSGMKGTLTVQ